MKKRMSIRKQFRFDFYKNLYFVLFGVVGTVSFITSMIATDNDGAFYWFLILSFGFLAYTCLVAKSLIPYLLDKKQIKNKNYCIATGKVIGFIGGEDNEKQRKTILQCDDGKNLVLKVVMPLEKGQNYTLRYLKHTKIANV